MRSYSQLIQYLFHQCSSQGDCILICNRPARAKGEPWRCRATISDTERVTAHFNTDPAIFQIIHLKILQLSQHLKTCLWHDTLISVMFEHWQENWKKSALGNTFHFLLIKLNTQDSKEEIVILLFFLFHNINIHAFIFTEYLKSANDHHFIWPWRHILMTSVISHFYTSATNQFSIYMEIKTASTTRWKIFAGPAVYASSRPAWCSGVWTSEALLLINIRKKVKTEPSHHPASLNMYTERTLISIRYFLEIFQFECDLRAHHLNIQKISSWCQ